MPASGWIEPVTLRSGKRRWRVHWYDPGRRHRSRTFDKRAEAERFQAYVRLRTSGPEIAPPPEVTVGWVIEHLWKPTLKHRAPATRDKNEALIKHTAPLWRKPIRSVTIAEVEVLWDQLLDRGLSYHTVSGVKSQLKLAFDQAMKAEYVDRNVVAASKVERPRVSGEDGRVDPDEVLPPSEFARIVKAAPEWSKEAFVVLAFTGIRQGELAALRVKDWNGTHLSIRHSRSRATKRNSNTGEYGELGPAKTNASIRVLEVPLDLGDGAAEGELVSVTATGDLTINGVTNPATFELEAQLVDGMILVTGTSDVVFADYDVAVPSSRAVLSVEDFGIIEVQLWLVPETA